MQTIKSISLAPWNGREQTVGTWYEPLREQDDIDLAVHWVLGRPSVFLNTVGDVGLLPRVLDAANRFEGAFGGAPWTSCLPAQSRLALLVAPSASTEGAAVRLT